jgi:hypothetical protein
MISNFVTPLVLFYLSIIAIVIFSMFALAVTKRLFILWLTLLVLMAWFLLPAVLYNVPITSTSPLGTPQRGASDILLHVKYNFSLWYWIPLLTTFMLFFAYLWWGGVYTRDGDRPDGPQPRWYSLKRLRRNQTSTFYESVVLPRRPLWLIFSIVVLSTLLISTSLLIELQQRIVGQHPLQYALSVVVDDMKAHEVAINLPESTVYKMTNGTGLTQTQWTDIFNEIQEIGSNAAYANQLSQQLYAAAQTATTTETVDSAAPYSLELKPWLAEVTQISSNIVTATNQIMNRKAEIEREAVYTPTQELQTAYQTIADSLQVFRYLNATISARSTAPFVSIAILYAAFLFLPWLIYFSYLLSKRVTISRETRRDLDDFGLLHKFLDPTTPTWDEPQSIARQLAYTLEPVKEDPDAWDKPDVKHAIKMAWKQAIDKGEDTQYHELRRLMPPTQAQPRPSQGQEQPRPSPERSRPSKEQWTLAYNEAVEVAIKMRQFYNREYIIALVLYTVVSGVGWHYIFFGGGSAVGLRQFIDTGGASSIALNNYLANNISPVTAAFIGAWLFGMLMLLHNWTNDDLNPRSFFYAATRLIIGMLVGLVLANLMATLLLTPENITTGQAIASQEAIANGVATANLLAFAIGIFPYNFIAIVVREVMKWFSLPIQKLFGKSSSDQDPGQRVAWTSKHQLDELDDVTAWDQARLEQEGVDSIHSLALANLERLIINTPYEGPLLADWVDQALLRVHVPDDLLNPLHNIGVRTASTLVAICRPAAPKDGPGKGQATNRQIKTVADALEAFYGRKAGAKSNGSEDAAGGVSGSTPVQTSPAQEGAPAQTSTSAQGTAQTQGTTPAQRSGQPEVAQTQAAAQTANAKPEPAASATIAERRMEDTLSYILKALDTEPNMVYIQTFWSKRRIRIGDEINVQH